MGKLYEFVILNPKETLPKGTISKKIAMDKLQPFTRDILGYDVEPYAGGTKFRNGDTIMARITPCLENGKIAQVNILDENEIGFGSTEYIVFRAKEEVTDPDYVYYLVCSSNIREVAIKSMVGSSGRQRVQTDVVQNIEIEMPIFDEQVKIASILKSFDDKITLNNAIIKSSWWTDSGIKVIKIGSINQDNLNLLECSYVDENKINKVNDFKVRAGDLLIAMTGATIGKFAMVPYSSETLLVNQRVGKFFLGNKPVEKLPFIYCTLKQPDVYYEIVNRGQGSAQPNISGSDIMSIPCVIPSKEAIDEFNCINQPLFDLIISNQRENQQLSKIRDTILPKLMSGELDVSDIDL